MATIELSAKSLDEAKALAAKQLDVDAGSVKIEVLEEGFQSSQLSCRGSSLLLPEMIEEMWSEVLTLIGLTR